MVGVLVAALVGGCAPESQIPPGEVDLLVRTDIGSEATFSVVADRTTSDPADLSDAEGSPRDRSRGHGLMV